METEYPKAVFAVRLETALKVKPFISKDAVRYYLHGISVEKSNDGGAVCVATDGHRLGASRDEQGVCLQTVIAKLPAIFKINKRDKTLTAWMVGVLTGPDKGYVALVMVPRLAASDSPALWAMDNVDDCAMRVGDAFIQGTYPDWRRVMPKPEAKVEKRGFNGSYLASFGDYISISVMGEREGHLVQTPDDNFIGVIMPKMFDDRPAPTWWKAA